MHFEKRTVLPQGYVKWQNKRIFIGKPLAGHLVGLEPIADALCAVHFYQFLIGHIDQISNEFL